MSDTEPREGRDAGRPPRLAPARFASGQVAFNDLRREVADLLRTYGAEVLVDDAMVIVTELANNAALHAGTAFEVRGQLTDHVFRIEVGDTGTGQPVVNGGLGLRLVGRLASRWGVSSDPPGKVVWAELNRTDRRR